MIQKATAKEELNPVIMEVETDPVICAEVAARHRRCQDNYRWLQAHAEEAYSHRAKYICISGQEVFVADSAEGAWQAGKSARPGDDGRFVLYIPLEKLPRIRGYRNA
ncbi:MAG TPA: hypothetical protein VFI31_25680 [Pirellulales bacterium]|nr:hypothetical protein [Pirellulales bacterium]